ncbi:hypothetical protein QJS10_CPA08g00585 [Acorus calamus]|uniref:Uncharacterized protein n=1 Tax=Acorus calamus TaxID=4465 RepID=A0AAV9ECX6_ACOCL|nr:hypothetical protein QJS10_CPA08g00585 [Acorus calamus]
MFMTVEVINGGLYSFSDSAARLDSASRATDAYRSSKQNGDGKKEILVEWNKGEKNKMIGYDRNVIHIVNSYDESSDKLLACCPVSKNLRKKWEQPRNFDLMQQMLMGCRELRKKGDGSMRAKAVRHLESWSKYQFVCRCGHCNTSPQPYVDRVLNESASNLNTAKESNHDFHDNDALEEVANIVEEAVAEYMSYGDAKSCCCKLETCLLRASETSNSSKDSSRPNSASAYNTRSRCIPGPELVQDYRLGALEMAMAAAAYSLLLAGATNHLLSVESSLIASASVFWINAGESILGVVKRLRWFTSVEGRSELGCPPETEAQLGVDCCYSRHPITPPREISGLTQEEFMMTCTAYLDCILEVLQKSGHF